MEDDSDSRNAAFSKRKWAADEEGATGSGSDTQAVSFAGWNRGVKSNIRPSLGRTRLGSALKPPTAADKLESSGQPVKRSASPSAQLGLSQPAQAITKARASLEPVVKPTAPEYSSSEEGEIQSAFSGDDEAVVINVAQSEDPNTQRDADQESESELESGEITDDQDSPAPDLDEESGGESHDMDLSDDGEPPDKMNDKPTTHGHPDPIIIDLEDDDGSMIRNATGPTAHPMAPANSKAAQSHIKATTLADLTLEDLNLQLRYFHVGQDPASIPLSEPVRCLSCSAPGHASPDCPELTCLHCGMYNSHFSNSCDQIPNCAKCGRRGHDTTACPSKLRATADDLICEICGCHQHVSAECEAHWRTSQFPPNALAERSVRMYCYECANAGHLGNDCPSRQPGRSMGTSMWSAKTMPGGIIPPATGHFRPPLPDKKKQKQANQLRNEQNDSGPLVNANRVPVARPKNAPIKIGSNIAQNRSDLQNTQKQPPLPKNSNKAPGPRSKKAKNAPGQSGPSKKKKKKSGPKGPPGPAQGGPGMYAPTARRS